jgi:predicted nucleic-acid-binding protein
VIGLDTNVLVRYIMQDDDAQSALATRLLESLTAEAPGFVPLVAVVELAWVLSSAYELDKNQLVTAFEALLRTKEIVVERAETVWKALRVFGNSKADFADCLIERSAAAAGCERTMTFDRGTVKGCGMVLVG